MNRKGDGGDNLLGWYVAYLILGIGAFALAFYWVSGFQGRAAMWQNFYAQEIAHIVNEGKPGDDVYLDVTSATQIALKAGVGIGDIFGFDNAKHEITVSLRPHSGARITYFNDVDVVYKGVETPSEGPTTNRLHFVIAEKRK